MGRGTDRGEFGRTFSNILLKRGEKRAKLAAGKLAAPKLRLAPDCWVDQGVKTVSKRISASQEDYLEAILDLRKPRQPVRVKDIAAKLGVKMPSVTRALHLLAEQKLVDHPAYREVTLTPKGVALARRVKMRHEVFTAFFTEILGIDPRTAADNACRLEHVIDEAVLDRMVSHLEFVRGCPYRDDTEAEGCEGSRESMKTDGSVDETKSPGVVANPSNVDADTAGKRGQAKERS